MVDPVMLQTTLQHTGEVKLSGPWERDMLEKWTQYPERGETSFCKYKIVECD